MYILMGVRGKKKYFLKYHIPYERSEESNYIFISKKKWKRQIEAKGTGMVFVEQLTQGL